MTSLRNLPGILLIILLLASHGAAHALPFFNRLPGFEIILPADSELQSWLKDELNKQRKGNNVLKNYEDARDVARYERNTLQKLLRSRGYYDSSVRQEVGDGRIRYVVDPGPQYRLKEVSIDMPDQLRPGFTGLPLQQGDVLEASKVLEGVKVLEKYLGKESCLLNIDVDYQVTVIHSERAARLEYMVAPSPEVVIGEVRIVGLTTIEEDFLRDKLKIGPGQCFHRSEVDATQLRLLRTNLISGVTTEISDPVMGVVDVTFVVQERKHRTIKLGVGYTSDEGAGVSAGWEHRNVFHRGEKIEVESKVTPVQQTLKGTLKIPRFLRDKQSFTAKTELSKEERDSYDAESLTVGATISRRLSKHRTASIGTELKFSDVTEDLEELEPLDDQEELDDQEDYTLLSFPLGLKWDSTDNPLDARKGATAALEVKPYVDLRNNDTTFTKTTLLLSGFHTFEEMSFKPTVAVRLKAGVISNSELLEIPADERFYAGGGGSVRGYGYQELGPRRLIEPTEPDEKVRFSDVIGGRALSEVSLEARLRFNETWGGVLFVDGGNAYADTKPRFDSSLFWGAGIGVRYFTSFAPLRVDIAFPLDSREYLDDDFQIYVSLGQAF